MNDRNCDNCIYHEDGGCTVWDCTYMSREEARERLGEGGRDE